jgi:hypothetical protein
MAISNTRLPNTVYSTPMEWDRAYIVYNQDNGICICDKDNLFDLEFYEEQKKCPLGPGDGDGFVWVRGEITMKTTEGIITIPFTDIIEIYKP